MTNYEEARKEYLQVILRSRLEKLRSTLAALDNAKELAAEVHCFSARTWYTDLCSVYHDVLDQIGRDNSVLQRMAAPTYVPTSEEEVI